MSGNGIEKKKKKLSWKQICSHALLTWSSNATTLYHSEEHDWAKRLSENWNESCRRPTVLVNVVHRTKFQLHVIHNCLLYWSFVRIAYEALWRKGDELWYKISRVRYSLINLKAGNLSTQAQSQGWMACTYLQLAICLFVLDDGSPSAETCFDTTKRLPLLSSAPSTYRIGG